MVEANWQQRVSVAGVAARSIDAWRRCHVTLFIAPLITVRLCTQSVVSLKPETEL